MSKPIVTPPPQVLAQASAEQKPARNAVYKEGAGKITIPDSNSSEALFGTPEPIQEQAPVVEPPVVENKEVVAEEKKEEAVATPEPETQEEIDLEDFLRKNNLDPNKVRIKTKVDGIESAATLAEMRKNYQLEQHLTRRGQKIGEERRQLEALRESLAKSIPVNNQNVNPQVQESSDPVIRSLQAELQQLKSVMPALEPVIYQNARQQLANELKAQGFPDFMDFVDKIDARVAAEADDNKWRYYNTPDGAKQLYFQMKLEEQAKNKNVQAAKPIVTPVPQPSKPPIVRIDGGGQPSGPLNDDYQVKMDALMTKWKQNPRDKATLNQILKMKGVVS